MSSVKQSLGGIRYDDDLHENYKVPITPTTVLNELKLFIVICFLNSTGPNKDFSFS